MNSYVNRFYCAMNAFRGEVTIAFYQDHPIPSFDKTDSNVPAEIETELVSALTLSPQTASDLVQVLDSLLTQHQESPKAENK